MGARTLDRSVKIAVGKDRFAIFFCDLISGYEKNSFVIQSYWKAEIDATKFWVNLAYLGIVY